MVKCVGEWVYGRKGTSLRRESVTGTCGGGRNEKKKKKLGRMYKKKMWVNSVCRK
jgi:hypothetical protein